MAKVQALSTFNYECDWEKFEELDNYIEKQRKFGKIPLFVIGAGVSYSKVATMNRIFERLKELLDEFLKKSELQNGKVKKSAEYALNLVNVLLESKSSRLAESSHFFSILQEELKEHIWKRFTKEFIKNPKLDGASNPTPIYELTPTDFHMYVAEQIVKRKPPAICVSINYDGLTARAVQKKAIEEHKVKMDKSTQKKKLYPARVLSSPEDIDNFYRNPERDDKIYPVIKLKGDIFYAKCKRNGCEFARDRIPIYKYYPENVAKSLDRENILRCPECESEMELELDFPGKQKKEEESRKMIEKIIQYFLPSISCVVVCGVSGKWDIELVNFFKICMNKGIKVFNLNINKVDLMREMGLGELNPNFEYIKIDFTKWKFEVLKTIKS